MSEKALWHYTTTSRHLRRSPRSEVQNDIVEMLLPVVAAGGGEISPGLNVMIHFGEPCAPGDTIVFYELGRDLVRCTLYHYRPWPVLVPNDNFLDDIAFLSVDVLPAAVMSGYLMMLGDAERCVAWAILEK